MLMLQHTGCKQEYRLRLALQSVNRVAVAVCQSCVAACACAVCVDNGNAHSKTVQHIQSVCCRDGKGAAPSKAVYNDELVKLDPDWIIICPCGLDTQVRKQHSPTNQLFGRLGMVAAALVQDGMQAA
jgi:hypothetical protein